MALAERIRAEALGLEDFVVETRRRIHTYAETSGKEIKTSALVRAELESRGIPFRPVADTALIATWDTGREGPSIALRADMDALPIRESPNHLAGPRTCLSEQEGTCHACGHDAHTAMLLGSLRGLLNLRDELCGVIHFCFEEGEENGGSALQMVEALRSLKPDTAWALHVEPSLESGRISAEPGPRMAGSAGIEILVKGKGGHGSRPDLCANPVFTAASIVAAIPGVLKNQLDPEKPVACGITTILGGGTGNVFPDTAEIKGSLRFFDPEEGVKAVSIVKNTAEHTAAINGCAIEYGPRERILGAPLVNEEHCTELARRAISEVLPEGTLAHLERHYSSESFGKYLQIVPGLMAYLGVGNPEAGSGASLHNQFFDVDERALKYGVMSTLAYAAAYMGKL